MKNIYLLFLLLLVQQTGFSQWSPIGPAYNKNYFMGSGLVNSVEFHPTDANIMYIGTYGGIWNTSDGGGSWSEFAANKEFEHTITVGNVVADKSNPTILYASTGSKEISRLSFFYALESATSGVYRCNINGSTKTWTKISSGLPGMNNAYGIAKLPIGYFIHHLQLDPFDSNILYAGTSIGLYKTTNAQSATPSWQKITAIPTNTVLTLAITGTSGSNRVIYVSGKDFIYKSSDGTNWTQIAGACSGCFQPSSEPSIAPIIDNNLDIVEAAVLEADNTVPVTRVVNTNYYLSKSLKYPGHVYTSVSIQAYAYSTKTDSDKFYKIIAKYDGSIWDNSPIHLLPLTGPPAEGSGISSYNPHITVGYNSSASSNESIYAAYEGIEGYVENSSSPSGYSYFKTGYPSAYVYGSTHPDFHDLKYNSLNHYLYGGNDGFMAKYNPVTTFISNDIGSNVVPIGNLNLNCSRIWHQSISPHSSSKIAIGQQDNGTNMLNNNTWEFIFGGDGIDQLIQGSAYSYCYQDVCYLDNNNSSDSYKMWKEDKYHVWAWRTIGYPNPWYYKAFYWDPVDTNMVYVANGSRIFKSYNKNTNLEMMIDFGVPPYYSWNTVSAIAISRLNNNIMYVALSCPNNKDWGFHLFKTSNATSANPVWTRITSFPTTTPTERCRGIVMSSINEDVVFVSLVNNSTSANKHARILKSTDGGGDWEDYNNSMNTIPYQYQIHCLMYEKGSKDGVYAGTDNGIYYTNRTMTEWIRYDAGLPNVAITALNYHPSDNKIIASTWGRGVWEVYPYCLPEATVTINNTNYLTHMNRPTQANGNISFSYTMPNPTGPGTMPYRFEIRSTTRIDLLTGANFNANSYAHTLFEAYITPCEEASTYRVADGTNEVLHNESVRSPDTEENIDLLKIYPNPSNGEIKIAFNTEEKEESHEAYQSETGEEKENLPFIIILTTDGKEIYREFITDKKQILDVNIKNNPDGIYILRLVENGKTVYTDKIMLTKTNNTEKPSKQLIPEHKNK